jgi:hypothetical protein
VQLTSHSDASRSGFVFEITLIALTGTNLEPPPETGIFPEKSPAGNCILFYINSGINGGTIVFKYQEIVISACAGSAEFKTI